MSDSSLLGNIVGVPRIVIITDDSLPFCSSEDLLSKQHPAVNTNPSYNHAHVMNSKRVTFSKESLATCHHILRSLHREIFWLSLRDVLSQQPWSSYDCHYLGHDVCMIPVEHEDLLSQWWLRFFQPNLVIIQDIASEKLCRQLYSVCRQYHIPYALSVLNDIDSCDWLTTSIGYITRQTEISNEQGRAVTYDTILHATSNAEAAKYSFSSEYVHSASAIFVQSDVLAKQLFQLGRLNYRPWEIQVIKPCRDTIVVDTLPHRGTASASPFRALLVQEPSPIATVAAAATTHHHHAEIVESLQQCLNQALVQARKTYRIAILTTWCDDSVGLMSRSLVRTLITNGCEVGIFAYRPSWIQRKNHGDSRDGQRDPSEWVSAVPVYYSTNSIHSVDITELSTFIQLHNVGVCIALEHPQEKRTGPDTPLHVAGAETTCMSSSVIKQLRAKLNIRVYALPAITPTRTPESDLNNNVSVSPFMDLIPGNTSLWDYHAYNGVLCQHDFTEQLFRMHGFQDYQLFKIGFAPTPLLTAGGKMETSGNIDGAMVQSHIPVITDTVRLLLVGGLHGWIRKHVHINLQRFVDAYAYIIEKIKRQQTIEQRGMKDTVATANSHHQVSWRNVQLTVTVQTTLDPEEIATVEHFRRQLVELRNSQQNVSAQQQEAEIIIPAWDIVIRNDHLSCKQIRQLYQTHHLVLELETGYTSLTSPVPSFGLGTYEALAAGCPVVVSRGHPFIKNNQIQHLCNGIIIDHEEEVSAPEHNDAMSGDRDIIMDSYEIAVRQFYLDLASRRLDTIALCESTQQDFTQRFCHQLYAERLLNAIRL